MTYCDFQVVTTAQMNLSLTGMHRYRLGVLQLHEVNGHEGQH